MPTPSGHGERPTGRASHSSGQRLRPLALTGQPIDAEELTRALADALEGGAPLGVIPAGPPDFQRRAAAALRTDEPVPDAADPIVLVLLTSGSTGTPKAAMLTRGGLIHAATASARRLGDTGDWLLALPPGHAGGAMVLVRAVLAGTRVRALPLSEGFSSRALTAQAAAMDSSRPAFVSLVPTQLRRVLADGAQAALAGFHSVLLGGDAADQRLLQRAQQSGINVVTTYGMTETCGGCVYDGVPLEGMSVTLEPDQRIVISGPSVAAGYRNDPAATARCFTAGTFRTDDQGRWDDGGRLEVRGRLDDAVMSGGFTVSPPLVEALLCEHPAVEQACVVGLPDSRWGQVVAGMVVLRSEGGPDSPGATDTTLRAVTDHVAANAERAAVPRRLVAVADLPRSSSGKIDRAAVRQALADDPGH